MVLVVGILVLHRLSGEEPVVASVVVAVAVLVGPTSSLNRAAVVRVGSTMVGGAGAGAPHSTTTLPRLHPLEAEEEATALREYDGGWGTAGTAAVAVAAAGDAGGDAGEGGEELRVVVVPTSRRWPPPVHPVLEVLLPLQQQQDAVVVLPAAPGGVPQDSHSYSRGHTPRRTAFLVLLMNGFRFSAFFLLAVPCFFFLFLLLVMVIPQQFLYFSTYTQCGTLPLNSRNDNCFHTIVHLPNVQDTRMM